MRLTSVTALTLALAGAFSQVQAAPVDWAVWSSNTTGTAGSVDLTYAGESFTPTGGDIWLNWGVNSTYADGVAVNNGPVAPTNNKLSLQGGNAGVNTVTFSTAVTNPVFAIWSLGQPGQPASFVFTQTPTFVAGGPNIDFGGSAVIVDGNMVSGVEGNGTVQFLGTYNSISWTSPVQEFYYSFTVGVVQAPVPEPETYLLMLAGLGALGFVAKRRAG